MTNTSRDGIVRKMTVQFLFLIILNLNFTRILLTGKITRGAGGGGTALHGLYRYVPL